MFTSPDAYASTLASVLAWLCSASASLSAITFVGLAVWWAMRPPLSVSAVLGQWALATVGALLCVVGLAVFGGLLELVVGSPRAYSGAGSIVAYWLGFRLAKYDAAIRAAQFDRLAAGASSGWRAWATALCVGFTVVERILFVVVIVVAIGMTTAWYAGS